LQKNAFSTIFPELSLEEMTIKIFEACDNPLNYKSKGGKTVIEGIANEGLKIEIIVHESSGLILSAYPI